MKPKKDPIKPIKSFTKKPNFKEEKLDTDYFSKVDLSVFRSPGVFTIERDISIVSQHTADIEYLQRQLLRATRIPSEYLNGPPQQLQSQEDVTRIFGELSHPDGLPISISSRQIQGGESMMYNATTTMVLPSPKKKKNVWGRMKDYISNIYKKWKRAE
jgi:hypothetical protein